MGKIPRVPNPSRSTTPVLGSSSPVKAHENLHKSKATSSSISRSKRNNPKTIEEAINREIHSEEYLLRLSASENNIETGK